MRTLASTIKRIDPLDIEDIFLVIEKSFNIRFENNELAPFNTFGEICDHINDKVKLQHAEGCTTQQAFYKLREVIASLTGRDAKTINTDTLLVDLLPRGKRGKLVHQMEQCLRVKLHMFKMRPGVVMVLTIGLLLSFGSIFIEYKIGFVSSIAFILAFINLNRTTRNMRCRTLGEVAQAMVRENYLKSRRDQNTVNKHEIAQKVKELFLEALPIDEAALTRDAKFVE